VKRAFDFSAALVASFCLLPLFALIAVAVWADSGRPIFFRQKRMGRFGLPFELWKFRTMRTEPGQVLTVAGDRRITGVGRRLRATHLDELPQLWNILRGEMSLVGPRPELPDLVARCPAYSPLLQFRPGLTDPATLAYRNEAAILAGYSDPIVGYLSDILPRKVQLSQAYGETASLRSDIGVLWMTVKVLFG
jgi:lipopolysaccharide/colanic/teichoic acid biosynthesis glycosyltransferase